jgi:CRISPR system Cascade subunit CasB
MYSLVVPWVPEQKYAEDAAFLVAALFALHPLAGGQGTLGAAFARISEKNDSIEQRFVALLNCHRDDLPDYLRQAISLLRSKDVPVAWRRVLQDVLGWDHESRYVQRAWARDFWRSARTAEASETETETTE